MLDLSSTHRKKVVGRHEINYDLGVSRLKTITVEPRFNEPLFNEVLDITNDIISMSRQSYSKMYGKEPRYNEPSI